MNDHITEQLLDWVRNRYFGKYRGIVRDVDDPTARGRVKVSVPAVLGDLEIWAMPCLPYAGNGVGVYTIPETGSGIWVEFEAGDPSFPIWIGGFWPDNQLPRDEQNNAATPTLKIIRTAEGLQLSFNDQSQVISLSDSNGSNILRFEVRTGKITLQAQTKVVVEAPQIELVENSAHPLVFGDDLLTYLQQLHTWCSTHMHPGELAAGVLPVTPAPPTPPPPPPSPSMLSLKVKTG